MSDHANAARQPATTSTKEIVISVRDLVVQFGEHRVMDGLDLDVFRGEVLGFVGGSGQGKSVLMRAILGLLHKRAGVIRLFGQDRDALPPRQLRALEQRWGVLFQNGALFSSLTVRQNIQMPMRENRNISQRFMDDMLPKIGASTYTISRQAIIDMPQGDNTPLDKVILQMPGVSYDIKSWLSFCFTKENNKYHSERIKRSQESANDSCKP